MSVGGRELRLAADYPSTTTSYTIPYLSPTHIPTNPDHPPHPSPNPTSQHPSHRDSTIHLIHTSGIYRRKVCRFPEVTTLSWKEVNGLLLSLREKPSRVFSIRHELGSGYPCLAASAAVARERRTGRRCRKITRWLMAVPQTPPGIRGLDTWFLGWVGADHAVKVEAASMMSRWDGSTSSPERHPSIDRGIAS